MVLAKPIEPKWERSYENDPKIRFYFFESGIPWDVYEKRLFLGGMDRHSFQQAYRELLELDRYAVWNLISIDQDGMETSADNFPAQSVEYFLTKGEFESIVQKRRQRYDA